MNTLKSPLPASVILQIPRLQNDHLEIVYQLIDDEKSKFNFSTEVVAINSHEDALSIEMVRNLISKSSFSVPTNKQRYFIILNLDLASIPAQNALLKILEEPPNQTKMLLTATEIQTVLPTIRSRCITKHCKSLVKSIDDLSLATKPNFSSYSGLIDLAGQYKNKKEALDFIVSLIDFFQKDGYNVSSKSKTIILQKLLNCYQLIKKNINIKLNLEDCLFSIKKELETEFV